MFTKMRHGGHSQKQWECFLCILSRLRSDQEHSSARYPKVFTSFGCRVRLCPPSSSSKYGSSQLQDTVPQEKPRSSSSIEDRHGRAEGRREEKEISPPFPRYLCVLLAAPGNTHPKWPTIGIRNYIFYCGDADERRVGGNATAGRKDYNNLVEQFDSASPSQQVVNVGIDADAKKDLNKNPMC
ncbi:hypothetical protein RB195_022437 [Necator americanus]|uniref:Uncharacterized protein n=1 Tax=Necator americanus TaxID=51031 RepID=A0ABR1EF99_NECAM